MRTTTRDSFCARVVEKGARGYIRDDEKTKKSKRCDKTTRGWTVRKRGRGNESARVEVLSLSTSQRVNSGVSGKKSPRKEHHFSALHHVYSREEEEQQQQQPVSYTHLTLPTILLV